MRIRAREELETIHLYVVREDDHNPHVWLSLIPPIALLCLLLAVGVLYPYHPLLVRQTLKVPAILLPLKTFTTSEKVIPSGVQTFPAMYATGVLTITNGSVIAQHLPAGMIFTGSDGVEVVTTEGVDVPAGDETSYGTAYAPVQAVAAGVQGNIPRLDIHLVYGTSLYIINYRNFTGGKESYSRAIIRPSDTRDALLKARATLFEHTLERLLARPCAEGGWGTQTLHVTWTCQFVTYHVSGRRLSATVQGRSVVVAVEIVARKHIIEAK